MMRLIVLINIKFKIIMFLGESLGLAYPPSGMKITTSNLAKYMMMHMHGGILNGVRILSEDSEKRMRDNYVGKT